MTLQKEVLTFHEEIKALFTSNNITVSEWFLPSQSTVKPPYAVICDTNGEGVYADGKLIFGTESVKVHFIYKGTTADKALCSYVDEILKPYGYTWNKESIGAERVLVKTYNLNREVN